MNYEWVIVIPAAEYKFCSSFSDNSIRGGSARHTRKVLMSLSRNSHATIRHMRHELFRWAVEFI
jgi:hypothetical protein